MLAGQWMAERGLMWPDEPGRIATKMKIHFGDLVRPHGCNVVYGLHVGVAFEVFRWMVATGKRFHEYRRCGVDSTLNTNSTCRSSRYKVHGFTGADWKEDLRERFQFAVLDAMSGSSVSAWRAKYDIRVGGDRILRIRYRHPMWSGDISSAETERLLTQLLTAHGSLATSLNPSHPNARTVHSVTLGVLPQRYWLWLDYGYPDDGGWHITIAKQGPAELFTDFLRRSETALAGLLEEPKA